ncbi:MAG: N-acetylglucosamine-6-phosphate deacetylase [Proteiniphilum sp.]|jgi:N-acetylglucosamine-6-phosphate deacetylase|nr:N-acetylglucosamine-6-phosphate deacetylase [Proteiniphilum sp.]
MKRLIIEKGKVIFPDYIAEDVSIVCEEGKIRSIVPSADVFFYDSDERINASGQYVSPGFVDIHLHGGGGHDFMDGTVEAFLGAAELHARYGTTAMVPTTLTSTTEELMNTFSVYREAVKVNSKGAKFLGLHLEGPYFSYNQRGAQDPRYLRNPEREEYMHILESSEDIVRWSLAPELPGALDLGRELLSRNILAAVAHSDAVCEEVELAFKDGFSHITHLYSGMSSVTRRHAFRYAGVVEAAYLIDDMTVEIIADGVHLPRPLLQFVYKFKGADKIALCTDSMRGAGMPNGDSVLGSLHEGQRVIIEGGVAKLPDRSSFAGSVATADRMIRTMVNMAEVSLTDAVKMMTLTPARIMNVDSRKGSIKPGKDADLVIFDEDIRVLYTVSEGTVIYDASLVSR